MTLHYSEYPNHVKVNKLSDCLLFQTFGEMFCMISLLKVKHAKDLHEEGWSVYLTMLPHGGRCDLWEPQCQLSLDLLHGLKRFALWAFRGNLCYFSKMITSFLKDNVLPRLIRAEIYVQIFFKHCIVKLVIGNAILLWLRVL